jgi:hypothetical protein
LCVAANFAADWQLWVLVVRKRFGGSVDALDLSEVALRGHFFGFGGSFRLEVILMWL